MEYIHLALHLALDSCGSHGRGIANLAFRLALVVTLVFGPAAANAASCKSLRSLTLPNTKITLADPVPAGGFIQPSPSPRLRAARNRQMFNELPSFCRVRGEIEPTKDSDIKIEVWMPTTGWNGKFLGVGNGGWAGTMNYRALSEALRKGYATASTDAGHGDSRAGAKFALGHPEKVIDFGFRSVHLMTLRARAILTAYYGSGPRFLYWNACSTGGRQGLAEAQLFPNDYNGIVVGDPANYFTHLRFAVMWPAELTLQDPASYIPPKKLLVIHQAVLKACDALDGVVDGILNDPTRCHFDPKVLQCKGTDAPTCLTEAQVDAARKVYAGPSNPRNGKQIFPGLEPGSELGWHFEPHGPLASDLQLGFFKDVLFKEPDWQWQSLNFDTDVALADREDGEILNAINPDLSAFKKHGGKLIIYHGWSDPLIAPLNSVNYYNRVTGTMGGLDQTQKFVRLFMVPGMLHCAKGPGPDTFDKLGLIEQWVEQGKAPDRVIAQHRINGVASITRLLCPYPERAQWKGTGSTSDPANFVCVNRNTGTHGSPDSFRTVRSAPALHSDQHGKN